MLSTDKENSDSSGRVGVAKGRHVKRLNFGQPALQLSGGNELEAGYEEEVIGIRSVRKDDLVRKWLVSHAEGDRESVSVHPLPPVCRTYVSHLLESPVLGSRSRRRPRVLVAASTSYRIEGPEMCGESCGKDAESSKTTGSPVLGKVSSTWRKRRRNDETRACSVRPLSPAKGTDIPASPVADASSALKKRKNVCEGRPSTLKRRTRRPYVDRNMNSVKLIANPSNRFSYHGKLVSRSTSAEPRECQIPQTCLVLGSFQSKSQVYSEGRPSDDKECLQIETSSSDEDLKENLQNTLRCCSDSERTASDLIEDDESQHFSKPRDVPLLRRESEAAITSEQEMWGNDSPDRDSRASQRTSQVAAASGKVIDELSNPTDLGISEASSPPRMMSSAEPCPNLLDSGKKRRKPRKGSLLARLQLLINREKSFLRVWQHQTKNADSEKMQFPCILFCVKKYLTHFNKYFLEGDIVDDSSNLLTNASSWITVIIVSEITGVLRVKCGNVLKIYPPWDVVNLAGTAIIARKLSVVSWSNNINIQCAIEETESMKIIQEHACACTTEDAVVPDCKQLHSYVKPNALMYILGS